MITPEKDDERRLIDYLLGRLPPEEASSIEQRYLSDPAFHAEVRAAEHDLIDRYVRGEVAIPEELEQQFLASPRRRQRVAFARALNQSLSQGAAEQDLEAAEPIARASSWRRLLAGRPALWQAAAVVVLVVGAWLLVTDRSPQAPTPAVPPATQTAAEPQSPAQARPTPSPAAPLAPARVATLVLVPSLTRSSDEMPTVRLDAQTGIRLELHGDASGYARFQATIRTADGKDVARQDKLQLTSTPAGPAVIVALAAGLLDAGDYTIRLGGITPQGVIEEVGGYAFRVRRP